MALDAAAVSVAIAANLNTTHQTLTGEDQKNAVKWLFKPLGERKSSKQAQQKKLHMAACLFVDFFYFYNFLSCDLALHFFVF